MNILLSAIEARVIGCLIEKAITTPDQYPLSANALTNACNQKSNREPVLDLNERTVQETIDLLIAKHLVIERSGFGSRVPKYQHRFCNTGFGTLEFSPVETGILCELLLRGPQTPGELRGRIGRLGAEIKDGNEVEAALTALGTRTDGPFVVKLPREPSRRDSRYAHLFSGPVDFAPEALDDVADAPGLEPVASAKVDRIERLEVLVADLRREVEELKSLLLQQ
jgi:uncharacterized protein YceH (UPF0502 family)